MLKFFFVIGFTTNIDRPEQAQLNLPLPEFQKKESGEKMFSLTEVVSFLSQAFYDSENYCEFFV